MTHVMIDLETMGLSMTAPVLSIGACTFNRHRVYSTFRAHIPLREAVAHGAVVDPDTIEWWLQQPDEARIGILTRTSHNTIEQALVGFAEFLEEEASDLAGVWGNGAAFDNALLRETYRRAGIECPWSYKLDRCFRTVKEDAGLDFPRRDDLIKHDATHDAVHQAELLMAIWRVEDMKRGVRM